MADTPKPTVQKGHVIAVVGTVLTIAPQLVPVLPKPYADTASALIALGTALINLYQPAPKSNG